MLLSIDRPLLTGVVAVCVYLVLLIVYRLIWIPYSLKRYYQKQRLGGSTFKPLIGDLLAIAASRHRKDEPFFRVFEEGKQKFGPIYYTFLGPEIRLRVHDMAVVKSILSNQQGVYQKPSLMKTVLGRVLGEGLVTSEDPVHKLHRRMISPAFQWEKLRGMTGIMSRAADLMIDGVLSKAKEAGASIEVDFHHELSAATLAIIGEAAFGADFDGAESNSIYASVNDLLAAAIRHVLSGAAFIPFHRYLPLPENRRNEAKIAGLRGLLERIIAKRRAARAASSSAPAGASSEHREELLLDFLLDARDGAAKDANAVSFTNAEVLDHGLTFMLAGHETTSNALTWAMMLLGKPENRAWRQRARRQVMEVMRGKHSQQPSYDDIQQMSLLTAIVYETMRLYPPVPMIVRTAAQDMTVETSPGAMPGGASDKKNDTGSSQPNTLHIAAGTAIIIPIASIHRDPELWDDPHTFNPDRFKDGIGAAMKPGASPFSYLPFSHGPRNCIGSQFALLEAKVILARILQRMGGDDDDEWDWELGASYQHHPLPTITLRPAHGLPVVVKAKAA